MYELPGCSKVKVWMAFAGQYIFVPMASFIIAKLTPDNNVWQFTGELLTTGIRFRPDDRLSVLFVFCIPETTNV